MTKGVNIAKWQRASAAGPTRTSDYASLEGNLATGCIGHKIDSIEEQIVAVASPRNHHLLPVRIQFPVPFLAASSVPTVQQMGFAFGAAIAGLVANASGLSAEIADEGMMRAACWVPTSFIVSAILAVMMGPRLRHLRKT